MTFAEKLSIWGWVGSSLTLHAAAQTTEATPSSPAQSGTGTNSPQMQFYPPPLAPSSRINSQTLLYFLLRSAYITINAAQYPKVTIMASFVAAGH